MAIDDLIDDLRSRINPAYAMQLGTESYERRNCAEALEDQRAEIESLRARIAELELENAELAKDAARLDWLADVNNTDAAVLLPRHIIEATLDGGMRGAIDAAMTAAGEK